MQPVGAINEKIEGFFDLCSRRGLSGREGVVIPTRNLHHLMLRDDVVAAVRERRFRVHAVATVDDVMGLLSGRESGERGADGRFPVGSVNAAVERRLVELGRLVARGRAD